MTLVHGGNVYELAAGAGCSPDDILDYSASINPLGPPPGLWEMLGRHYQRLQHYPDINNRRLIDAVSRFHSLAPECVAAGNGSTELIYWLPKALGIGRALAVLPTFSEYGRAFELQGVDVARLVCGAQSGYQPRLRDLEEAVAKFSPEAVLLTHPGSPGGGLLSGDVVEWAVEEARRGRTVIVDEVFIDFCEHGSLKGFVAGTPNLVLIRSLTKFYGLPGLRIGYLLASRNCAERVRRCLPPWSVNTLAQAAGEYCLAQEEYRQRTLELIGRERREMMEQMAAISGLRVFPGEANYLLAVLDGRLPPVEALRRDLFEGERLLVRDCGSFEGLDGHHLRVAVRLAEQNRRLVGALRAWIGSRYSGLSS